MKMHHKLQFFRKARKEIFVYSASTNKREDGTYGHVSANKLVQQAVEMSDYQRQKGIQRKISRTRMDADFLAARALGGGGGGDVRGGGGEETKAPFGGGGGGGGGGGAASRKPVPIGTKIKREFPGYGFYEGTVVAYKKPFYRVVYPDGDSEQLLGKELRPLIQASRL